MTSPHFGEVFVSYTNLDVSRVMLRSLGGAIESLGRPFIDAFAAKSASPPQDVVQQHLEEADAFCVVLSPNYLRTRWTRHELHVARSRNLPLFVASVPAFEIRSMSVTTLARLTAAAAKHAVAVS